MYVCEVCAVDGRFKQPHLAGVRLLITLWGWVRLHPCGPLRSQCTQDKPTGTTHTLVDISDMEA